MHVQVNTDSNIEGDNALIQQVEAAVRETLDHFGKHITRVEEEAFRWSSGYSRPSRL